MKHTFKIDAVALKKKLNVKDGYTPKKGIDYHDGSPDSGADIVNKINALPLEEKYQIDAKHIKNNSVALIGFGGSANSNQSSSGSTSSRVVVSGTIDGINTAFTLPSVPANGILYLSLARQEQIEGVDFTSSGMNITYLSAPASDLVGQPHYAIIN